MSWIQDIALALSTLGNPAQPTQVDAPVIYEEPAEPNYVEHYPSEKHVRRNWPAERDLTYEDISALAQAQRQAEQAGIISPEVGKHLLPIAMVEGWGSGMGLRKDEKNALYATPSLRKNLDTMGLKEGEDYYSIYKGNDRHILPLEDITPENNIKMVTVYLGEYARQQARKGLTEPADVIKRYNGKGQAMERMGYDKLVSANVETYWGKVSEAHRLLTTHPKNSTIYNHYLSEYSK